MGDGRTLPATHLPEMMDRMPALVGLLADRIRETTRADQQREKLAALGKLSAAIAHELNNPPPPCATPRRACSRWCARCAPRGFISTSADWPRRTGFPRSDARDVKPDSSAAVKRRVYFDLHGGLGAVQFGLSPGFKSAAPPVLLLRNTGRTR